ncbi:hypothetical protein AVEN_8820-1 [Araneus ventricosus]|uniref:Uncharacterized protein n=1 Tax=Araneus ventricosus TaxID=182803 RepID=A0A4Y2TQL0_ARAVE|nr:hypothetical protein AVEN_8820-1 [Araneus ventricosus]
MGHVAAYWGCEKFPKLEKIQPNKINTPRPFSRKNMLSKKMYHSRNFLKPRSNSRWRHLPPFLSPPISITRKSRLSRTTSQLSSALSEKSKKIFSEIPGLFQMTQALNTTADPSEKMATLIRHLTQSVKIPG